MDGRFVSLPVCDVLGVRCAVGDVSRAADAVIERALSGAGGYGVLCNVHVLMTAQREPEVMSALETAWTVFPDGAPVAWLQRRIGMHAAERIGGPDLMRAVLDRGRAHGLRHALFGSTPDVVAALTGRLRERFPGVEIVAALAPARGEEDDVRVFRRVVTTRPHVVWCALGAPRQELWMARSAREFAPAIVLGVGAAFDFHAGAKERAPAWMQQVGLEWLHRLGSEPRRLLVRYVTTNTAFVGAAAVQLARRRLV
jgi:N-acetylglucosaminyldiphosphoundecaprenol N-acetyl-beta-D-mannosaminyltransferase